MLIADPLGDGSAEIPQGGGVGELCHCRAHRECWCTQWRCHSTSACPAPLCGDPPTSQEHFAEVVQSVEDLRSEGGKTQCQTQMWKLPSSSLDPVLFIFIRLIRSLRRFSLRFLQRVGSDFLPVPSKCHVPCAGRAIQHPVHLQGQRSQGH